MISVGTFRAINNIAFGNFKHSFVIDFNQNAVAFNKSHLQLIKQSSDRYEYIAAVLLRQGSEPIIREARAKVIDDAQFLSQLAQLPLLQMSEMSSAQHELATTMGGLLGSKSREFLGIFQSWQANPERWRNSYLGNSPAFTHLKEQIYFEQVHVLAADLSGTKTLRSLATWLKKRGLEVSVLDVSNSMEWIYEILSSTPGENGIDGLLANLVELPWALKARLLFTTSATFNYDHGLLPNVLGGKQWMYFSVPAAPWMYQAKKSYLRTDENLTRYIKKLHSMRDKQTQANEQLAFVKESCQHLLD